MSDERNSAAGSVPPGDRLLEGVTPVVLTHMRPHLAGNVTRSLIESEGFDGREVIVVVNGPGGLDHPGLERKVRMVRLPRNTGPAGGFRAGMVEAFADPATKWTYLCEDDIGLFSIPTPRIARLLDRLASVDDSQPPIGAVVAYGRRFVGRGAHTVNVVPPVVGDPGFTPVDVACWGATLVSRRVVEAGVLPDPEWFFGLEDFDFFCRVREAGFRVVVDDEAAGSVASEQTSEGREGAITTARPTDADEAWRGYYHARNSIELARRHGDPTWYAWHLAYSLRHLQKARSRAARSAILVGLWDGARGRLGENPRYGRREGEFEPPACSVVPPDK